MKERKARPATLVLRARYCISSNPIQSIFSCRCCTCQIFLEHCPVDDKLLLCSKVLRERRVLTVATVARVTPGPSGSRAPTAKTRRLVSLRGVNSETAQCAFARVASTRFEVPRFCTRRITCARNVGSSSLADFHDWVCIMLKSAQGPEGTSQTLLSSPASLRV